MIEIFCFDFKWQYVKSEFWPITNMQNSEPMILKVKICKETYSWFLKNMSQWLAETHKKFSVEKMNFFHI